MRRIGRVLHISPSQKAVIKTSKPPRIGETVFNGNGNPVGKVSDVFGPTSSPYVEVNVQNRAAHSLIGKMLYLIPSRRKKRSRRK